MHDSDDPDDLIALPTPVAAPAPAPERAIPPAADRLIKLRDKVFMAMSGDAPPTAELVEAIYRELGRALEAVGVTPVEDDGGFDHARHAIVETRPTAEPADENRICGTVRPGYLFDGRLLRAQEVVVYSLERAHE